MNIYKAIKRHIDGRFMKRIQGLDILRGIGMLGLVFMHAFEKVGWPNVNEIFFSGEITAPWYVWVPLGLIMYFASWRGFFLIISGASNMYGFYKSIQKGLSPHKVFFRRILWAILLFAHSLAIQIFWGPYTGLYLVFLKDVNPSAWLANLYWSDAVETIAIGIFISSIIQYLLSLGKNRNKFWISIGVNLFLMIVILVLKTYVVEGILQITGFSSVLQIKYGSVTNFRERMRLLGLALLIGEQQPIFPYLAITFLGNAIGIALTHPKIQKKLVVRIGYLLGVAFVIAAVLVGAFKDHWIVGSSIIPSDWFLLLGVGLQVWVLVTFLLIFDFSKNAQHRTKYTRTIRKAGIMSLTIFTLQALDYFPRWILMKISERWGGGYNFVGFYQLELGNSFLTSFVVLAFWVTLILLWSLINFTLSFDWIFEVGSKLLTGQKIIWKDPIRSREIINNAEIVFERNIEKEVV